MKIYIASPSNCFLLFSSHWSIHLFQNNRIRRPTRSVKLYIFHHITLPCMAFATPRYFSPVSTVSATNAWDYDPLFGAPTNEKKKKKSNCRIPCHWKVAPLKIVATWPQSWRVTQGEDAKSVHGYVATWLSGYAATKVHSYVATELLDYVATELWSYKAT